MAILIGSLSLLAVDRNQKKVQLNLSSPIFSSKPPTAPSPSVTTPFI
jgi:hypothetical protein